VAPLLSPLQVADPLRTVCRALSFQLASGSADDSIKIWDMRKLACAYTIPAHKSLVSDLKFFRAANERVSDTPFPAAAPADGPVKKEEEMDISLDSAAASAAAAAAAPAPLPSSAVNRSGLYLVSSGYDSTVKVWSSDDWQLVKSINTDSGKVMGVDADAEGKFLVAGSGNRNFQLFGAEDAL
jgi:U4/U6 small nuclear ribonucleoprotein PRP4